MGGGGLRQGRGGTGGGESGGTHQEQEEGPDQDRVHAPALRGLGHPPLMVCRSPPQNILKLNKISTISMQILHLDQGSTNGMNFARIEQMTEMPLGGSVLADRRALQRNLATFI